MTRSQANIAGITLHEKVIIKYFINLLWQFVFHECVINTLRKISSAQRNVICLLCEHFICAKTNVKYGTRFNAIYLYTLL